MVDQFPTLTADASTATTSSAPPAVLTYSPSSPYLAQARLAGSAGHHQPVMTADAIDIDHIRCQFEVLKLRLRNRALATVVPWLRLPCRLGVGPLTEVTRPKVPAKPRPREEVRQHRNCSGIGLV